MKKRFIFFAALAVFLAIAVAPANAAPGVSIIKGPYLQRVTPDSIVIMWETNRAADSWVYYGFAAPDEFSAPGPTGVKIHEIQLTGLAVDTAYYYTVTSGTVTSAESTFATAPDTERSFRFVAYGDTRTYPTDHAAVVQGIINTPGGLPEIVICTGDLVSDGDNKNVWGAQFFDPAHDLMINTPLLPIIGNHEGSGNLFRDFFSLGNNDYWFAFTYGGVRFIGLNTHNASYSTGSAQYTWLVGELQSDEYTNATWHIVYFHHPPYSSGSHGGDAGVQTHLVPLFELYGVDMVFSGHDHFYESSFKDGVHYVVTGGGGAPLRDINVNPNPYQIYAESTLHHCVIDVTAESLTLSARDNGGVEFDGVTLYNVDVSAPTASLIVPEDNGTDDLDADDGEVTVNTEQSIFKIQLSDVGDGVDGGTVNAAAVAITKDTVTLIEGTDYSFGGAGSDVITLTPAVSPFGNGLYVITLSGIADLAVPANVMAATTLTILIDTSIVPPVTLSFQQGVDGYSAMVDTMIRWATGDDNYADSATQHYGGYQYQYNADTDSSGGPCQILLRFDDIIGTSQIPSGSTIVSATLRIRSTDDGNGGKLHRVLQTWVDTVVTWNNSFSGNGIDADGSEAASVEDDGVPLNNPNTDVDLDVTGTVQAWADGATTNYGWAILPNGTNGWHIAAAEHTTLGYRPELIVTFLTTGNQPPVANDDSATTDEDTAVTIDVLANDTDLENDPLTIIIVSETNGTAVVNDAGTPLDPADDTVDFTPAADFSGSAGFTYKINDGIWNSNVATVTITVNPIADAPVANDDSASTMESMPVTIDVLANDTDVDGEDLTVTNLTQPTNGTVVNNGTDVTYTPNAGHTGEDSFTYTAYDGSLYSNVATVMVTTLELSLPGQATEPTPPDKQIRVNRNTVILSWLAGADAVSHDVYLGTDSANLPRVSAKQSETTYDPPKLGRQTTYFWRIDEVNAAGTTTGVVWSFTTN